MPTKQDLEDEINEILDTEFEFSQMKKDDLKLLRELLEGGELIEPQVKHLGKEKGSEKLEEAIDDWYPGKYAGKLL